MNQIDNKKLLDQVHDICAKLPDGEKLKLFPLNNVYETVKITSADTPKPSTGSDFDTSTRAVILTTSSKSTNAVATSATRDTNSTNAVTKSPTRDTNSTISTMTSLTSDSSSTITVTNGRFTNRPTSQAAQLNIRLNASLFIVVSILQFAFNTENAE